MKILQVNCVYKVGSTGKIMADIHHELLARGIDSVVCYGRGTVVREPGVHKTCGEWYAKFNNLLSRFTGIMYGGCWFSTGRLISIIKKEKPDIVHLHCINGYFVNIYRLIRWLKENHIKTVLTLHAEFMYTANCGHALDCEKWKTGCGRCPRRRRETKSLFLDRTARSWERMKEAFEGFDELKIVAVSDWIAGRASTAPVCCGHEIIRIHNGIVLDNFCPDKETGERERLDQAYQIPQDKRIILHVTPGFHSWIKGGDLFAKLAEDLPDDYQAVVVGCGEPISEKIVSVPFVKNQRDLAAIYRAADVLVITSRADTYPTVCIEANCCGTPVVGFDVGGVRESIGAGLGEVVPAFELVQMKECVLRWSKAKSRLPVEDLDRRRRYCGRSRMSEEYIKLYFEL